MADTNFTPSWAIPVGMNHVPAYQVSGIPWATGSIDVQTATKITFPSVTRWVVINNWDLNDNLKVGFSQRGVTHNSNYFEVGKQFANAGGPGSVRLELKVSELWLSGSAKVDVVAGLTSIQPEKIATSDGPSYSGSAGVG
jgi:hypothetical protein